MRPFCTNTPRALRPLTPSVMANSYRAAAIVGVANKWMNHTVLHYCFYTKGHYKVPKKQADAVRAAFKTWKTTGIGLVFKEVTHLSEAEVRIGFSLADGISESAVGRDVLTIPANEPTTTYGWDLTSVYGRGTALHEIGHVLGMEHEHQSPYAGIRWHDEAVYTAMAQPPNRWKRAMTYRNILQKLSTESVKGSNWDPDSIMQYEFEAGLIAEPAQYDQQGLIPPGKLSTTDVAWAKKWYPASGDLAKALGPFKSVTVELATGQQVDFKIEPRESRRYTIATSGGSDALLTLFEDVNGTPRFVAGDDDSGDDRNASIRQKLFSGRRYHVRLRLVYPGETGRTSVFLT